MPVARREGDEHGYAAEVAVAHQCDVARQILEHSAHAERPLAHSQQAVDGVGRAKEALGRGARHHAAVHVGGAEWHSGHKAEVEDAEQLRVRHHADDAERPARHSERPLAYGDARRLLHLRASAHGKRSHGGRRAEKGGGTLLPRGYADAVELGEAAVGLHLGHGPDGNQQAAGQAHHKAEHVRRHALAVEIDVSENVDHDKTMLGLMLIVKRAAGRCGRPTCCRCSRRCCRRRG